MIATIAQGDYIKVSERSFGGFRRVLFLDRNANKLAYILEADLSLLNLPSGQQKLIGASQERTAESGTPGSRRALGLLGSYSYLIQGERTETSEQGTVKIGAFSGGAPYYGLVFEYPLEPQVQVRTAIAWRKTQMKTQLQMPTVSDVPIEVTRTQEFFSFSLGTKLFWFSQTRSWLGVDVEAAKGRRASLTFKSTGAFPNVPFDTTTLPLYFFMHVSRGWSFEGAGLLFQPEVRLGAILNTSPMTYSFETFLTVVRPF